MSGGNCSNLLLVYKEDMEEQLSWIIGLEIDVVCQKWKSLILTLYAEAYYSIQVRSGLLSCLDKN